MKRGFTLIENVIAVAIFALIAGVIYETSTLLAKSIMTYRESAIISSLAKEHMEIVHNLPYSILDTDSLNTTSKEINGKIYQISYLITDDIYKQVKLKIRDLSSNKIYNFLTDIYPEDTN